MTPQPEGKHPDREQLLFFLHEAAEIEHNLMCCYLYAAFSLKPADERWSAAQAEAVGRWRRSITAVALEEMTHLCLVGNLMSAIGGRAHFQRPPFPIERGPYPADFVIRLAPFSQATIEHFQYLERPHDSTLRDGEGFVPAEAYARSVPAWRLSPGARDYATVGDLYTALRSGIEAFASAHGEAALFVGNPALQVDAAMAPLPGVRAVTDLETALLALDTIVTQGEGAGDEHHESHFCRFTRLRDELVQSLADDPSFAPAWPVATNPVMNRPPTAAGKVHIDEPELVRWLDIANALYTTSLRCMVQAFSHLDPGAKATWLAVGFNLMRAITPVGQGLASRRAKQDPDAPNAGLTFTPLRTLAALAEDSAASVVRERLADLRTRAEELPLATSTASEAASWRAVISALAQQEARLATLTGAAPPATPSIPSTPSTASTASSVAPAPALEVARGRKLSVLFEAHRCIHSRHCVLEAPTVFKANTPGEWIYPDTMPMEELIGVALACPSGAIRYERHDGGPDETTPAVNTIRIRENGPYAVRAALVVGDDTSHLRATLCRCGQSRRKPYCDGSHVTAAFVASGEPTTEPSEPLADRGGPLQVTPIRNGPLHVTGSVEICAGTGRTVARRTDARLCRCGHSRTKPFCDLSHVAAGFEAE